MPTRDYRNLEVGLKTNNNPMILPLAPNDFASAAFDLLTGGVGDAAKRHERVCQSIHASAGMQADTFGSVVSYGF